VVLFAKTGSGKTSLINAGARPHLEELDYATFYVRVEKDSVASLVRALADRGFRAPGEEERSLAAHLEYAAARAEKPIVVFFDQFEEFFLYAVNSQPEQARQFISDVAKLYRDRDSGVHLVFSMREEFFVEMNAFRDEIPSIFHNDSNLRLRWFNLAQARDAIVRPALRFDVEVEEALVEHLIADLQEGGRIEPARLQIVCHTLWDQSGGRMLLATYQQLGGSKQIINRRLAEGITENLDQRLLTLFEKLLPELVTERGTKYVRGLEELAKNLGWDQKLLQALADRLSSLGLIRLSTHSGAVFIEWTSDYLAERTPQLGEHVRTVLLRQRVRGVMKKAQDQAEALGAGGKPLPPLLTYEQRDALYLSDDEFEALSTEAGLLKHLDPEEARFLFITALEHGDHLHTWFDKAAGSGVLVWEVLRNRVTDPAARFEQAENAVRLLGELRTEEALELLRSALAISTLTSLAVKALVRMGTPGAMGLLEAALDDAAVAPEIIRVLGQARTPQAVKLLGSALKRSELSIEAEKALREIVKAGSREVAVEAEQLLKEWEALEIKLPPVVEVSKEPSPESLWGVLLRRIQDGRFTPIIGPGTVEGKLLSRAEIAQRLAVKFRYPFDRHDDLPQVAEFVAVQESAGWLRDYVTGLFEHAKPPSVDAEGPHAILASLPLPIYITSDYDDLMAEALRRAGKAPRVEMFRWKSSLADTRSDLEGGYRPTVAEPLVFHLQGIYTMPDSLVLTEDDCLHYSAKIVGDPDALPHQVQRALVDTQHMYIGYELRDATFRALSRGLAFQMRGRFSHVAVQLVPDSSDPWAVRSYIERYLDEVSIRVYWGTPREFTQELRQRWKEASHG
jgi:hypothetical protein